MDAGLIFVAAAVAGVVECLRRLKMADYWAAATIVAAGVVGALSHYVVGISFADGIVAGLGASGFITAASKVGGPTVSNVDATVKADTVNVKQ